MLYVLFCCGYQRLITLTFYTLCAAAVLSSQSYCMTGYVRRTLLKRMSASFMIEYCYMYLLHHLLTSLEMDGSSVGDSEIPHAYACAAHSSHTNLIEGSSWQHLVARIRIESEIQSDSWRRFSSCLSMPAVL